MHLRTMYTRGLLLPRHNAALLRVLRLDLHRGDVALPGFLHRFSATLTRLVVREPVGDVADAGDGRAGRDQVGEFGKGGWVRRGVIGGRCCRPGLRGRSDGGVGEAVRGDEGRAVCRSLRIRDGKRGGSCLALGGVATGDERFVWLRLLEVRLGATASGRGQTVRIAGVRPRVRQKRRGSRREVERLGAFGGAAQFLVGRALFPHRLQDRLQAGLQSVE